MYTNNQLPQPGRGRRSYSPEFKAQLVAACRIPGMSVASVARNHGINHNILHRWLRELPEPGALRLPGVIDKAVPAFIELPIAEPIAPAAVAADADADTVHVEVQRGDLSVQLRWPAAAAPACTQWLLELLR
jgi:transposase-like protein